MSGVAEARTLQMRPVPELIKRSLIVTASTVRRNMSAAVSINLDFASITWPARAKSYKNNT